MTRVIPLHEKTFNHPSDSYMFQSLKLPIYLLFLIKMKFKLKNDFLFIKSTFEIMVFMKRSFSAYFDGLFTYCPVFKP